MANNVVRKTSLGIPILPKIPRRAPRQKDFGFETIVNETLCSVPKEEEETVVNEKLASQPKKKQVQEETVVNEKLASQPKKKQVHKETVVNEKPASKSISFAVIWLWTTVIGVLKVRFQGGVSPKKTFNVNEKVKPLPERVQKLDRKGRFHLKCTLFHTG
ncbi:hypothetical protein V8G54_009156 [Vigna mungo]|uniref:Uncharacterized protein n=1 Tax=Vigna mungo TaxID=3915 RepID=A0AAQ3S572_VIGMU